MVERTKIEKGILAMVDHPNLVGLKFCFQTDDKVFFVMEFIQGGELFFHLKEKRRFPESQVKLYAAEIGSAIGYLHSKSII